MARGQIWQKIPQITQIYGTFPLQINKEFIFFVSVFPLFPSDFRVSSGKKILVFSVVFLAFLQKKEKKERKIREVSERRPGWPRNRTGTGDGNRRNPFLPET